MRFPHVFRLTARSLVLALLALAAAGCGRFFHEEEGMPGQFRLPIGTEIRVRPAADLSLEETKAGDEFAGVLAAPLYYKRELIDPEGKVFHKETLIAPEGAVVGGVVVAEPEQVGAEGAPEEAGLGLKLTKITLHGGMSFDITTDRVFKFTPADQETKGVFLAKKEDVLDFKLMEPANVALIIELRDREEEKPKEGAKVSTK